MKPTIPYIEQKFAEYNQLIFGGTLPVLPIQLSNAKTFLGLVSHNVREDENGNKENYNFRLFINERIDMSENEVDDVIIHEMIHYFIGYHQLGDTSSHGPKFREMMKRINEKFGRHVEISHKVTSAEEAEKAIDKRPKMHFVCVAKMKDGQTAIKVVPRIIQRICAFNAELPQKFRIEKMDWYFTTDPYFNRFPVSAAMKLYPVDPEELAPYLAASTRCIVTENSIREA